MLPVFSRLPILRSGLLLVILTMIALAAPTWSPDPVVAAPHQDDDKKGKKQDEKKKDGEKEDEDDEEKEKKPEKFTAEEKTQILDLFQATTKEFLADGRIRLMYDFKDREDVVLEDWQPNIDKAKNIRWAREYEFYIIGGIMVAGTGTFLHKARWQDDLKVRVTARGFSQIDKSGDYFAVAILDRKGKKGMGSNLGGQLLQLNGTRITGVLPKKFPVGKVEQRFDFGFHVKDGKFTVSRKDRDTKFVRETKKLNDFHAGMRWKGRIQVNIHTFVLEGTLSDTWLLDKL